jgi:outer membrane protein OmpA-like peptidoglycan-associated protein
MLKRVALAMAVVLGVTAAASAQTSGSTAKPQSSQPAPDTYTGETRPATTTILGDTGLWFVPTGEILPAKRWSASAYRVNFDYNEGFTDVSNWPVTFGYGIGNKVEIVGAWDLVRRIDRDSRPIFRPADSRSGGLVNDYPFVSGGWSDNQLGDFWVGGKANLMSEYHNLHPVAIGVRGMVKLPLAKDDEEGVGTGKVDILVDGIVSKEINQRVEVSGYGGFMFRGDPSGVDLSNGFRWGFGAGFPTRKSLRVTTEIYGEKQFDDVVYTAGTRLIGEDGSIPPAISTADSIASATLGVTWISRKGVFAGAGASWKLNLKGRSDFGPPSESIPGDAFGFQFRVGYHPGVRIYVPPPPPPPPPPAPAAPKAEHVLGVKASCNPCTVEVGKQSTVTAVATSSINCVVTYAWSAPSGTFTDRTGRQTPWTAPNTEGTVPVTVTVTCPQDGKTASDTVNINVIRPAVVQVVFEDVHFDFDRYSLRPEATRALDEAVKAMQSNPALRIQIEGHTCNIGTAEYNLALGDRRANSVRDYLTSRGISAERLGTVSYGEERPKHDNSREETRRLNRRAALVVKVQ